MGVDPDDTKEDVFHAPIGDTTAFYMLREDNTSMSYYEDSQLQAVSLRFKTNGGMWILLPKDGNAAGFLSSMTGAYFEEISQNRRVKQGKLLLPRFSINSGVMELGDILTALGVSLFDKNNTPLTGGLVEDDLLVWLSSAVQKAVIEVDEKGTTAAAVTVMAGGGTAALPSGESFEMICNSPFAFVLYGDTGNGEQILFTGIVNQP